MHVDSTVVDTLRAYVLPGHRDLSVLPCMARLTKL